MTGRIPAPRVLVPRTPVRSKAGRALGWIALPWAVGFAVVTDAILGAMGWPRSPRPPLLQIAIVLGGIAPAATWFFAGWLGGRQRLAWLLESPQPTLVLDADGLTVVEGSNAKRIPWSDIAAVRGLHPSAPSRIIGSDGATIGEIPGPLVTPRIAGNGETSLADELAVYHPRLARVEGSRSADQLVPGIVLAFLAVIGAIGAIILLTR